MLTESLRCNTGRGVAAAAAVTETTGVARGAGGFRGCTSDSKCSVFFSGICTVMRSAWTDTVFFSVLAVLATSVLGTVFGRPIVGVVSSLFSSAALTRRAGDSSTWCVRDQTATRAAPEASTCCRTNMRSEFKMPSSRRLANLFLRVHRDSLRRRMRRLGCLSLGTLFKKKDGPKSVQSIPSSASSIARAADAGCSEATADSRTLPFSRFLAEGRIGEQRVN